MPIVAVAMRQRHEKRVTQIVNYHKFCVTRYYLFLIHLISESPLLLIQ